MQQEPAESLHVSTESQVWRELCSCSTGQQARRVWVGLVFSFAGLGTGVTWQVLDLTYFPLGHFLDR